jgi:hypothetical protein
MGKFDSLIFIGGAIIGGLAASLYFKRRYEQIAQEEIDSVKEAFSGLKRKRYSGYNLSNENEKTEGKKVMKKAFSREPHIEPGKKEKTEDTILSPYVISPDEFGTLEEYERISLKYYSDGILTDEDDDIMKNYDDTVGNHFDEHFGEYEDDSVFIRNDRLKCDFEILKNLRPYYKED